MEILIKSDLNKILWLNFIQECRLNPEESLPDKIIINLKNCSFLEPFHVVSLACLIEEFILLEIPIEFVEGENLELLEYLTGINFFLFWNLKDRGSFLQNSKASNMPLWKINPTMITQYIVQVQNYYEQNHLKSFSVEPLYHTLAETFNNILDHSKSKIFGYCITQYYPNKNKLKIAVCDFGKGISKTVNDFLLDASGNALPDHIAISKAFELGFSSKSNTRNKGFGLDTIKVIVESSNGLLRVIANKGCFTYINGKYADYNIRGCFNGTILEIVLDTTTFEEKDSEELAFDMEL
ncbi:MAG TPA: GHKL domain-containing protein [Saprospiraceae bacterium]|nr:GHKL domain-containing protein [Saprospiraceae bacterium]HPN70419.1 GHKL domain-containing protein [Saprospiraceae bacterium]